MKRALPIAIAIFVSGMLSFGLSRIEHPARPQPAQPQPPPASAAPVPSSAVPAPAAVTGRLDEVDRTIASYRARAEQAPDRWLDWEFVALASIDRARLTGSYLDWRAAEDAIDRAFAVAPAGSGPHLTRATFNMAMHRIDRVEPDLAHVDRSLLLSSGDRRASLSLHADARFYAGDYTEARTLYEQQAAATRRAPSALVALAQLEWKTGHFERAAALFDEALAHPEASESAPTMRGWVLSVRATMERDRGRLEDALTAIRAARALLPDDAHTDELFAEILEARGSLDPALETYRDVAERTESPQAMDGAARIAHLRGDAIAEGELVQAARQSYEAQIALYPEAAYGHAIDHWLRLEPDDVDRMIAIAEGNAEARPYGETQTKLAMAYLLAGRTADAARVVDATLATEWSTGELHAVAALVRERRGADGASERAAAEALAPGVMDRLAFLAPMPEAAPAP
jgi:tetratricopeptide (TPR) repeat protein